MAKGRKTGGRQKGTPNKVTGEQRHAIHQAFDELGGVPSFVAWGKVNPDGFYALWGRTIPKHVDVTSGGKTLSQDERNRRLDALIAALAARR